MNFADARHSPSRSFAYLCLSFASAGEKKTTGFMVRKALLAASMFAVAAFAVARDFTAAVDSLLCKGAVGRSLTAVVVYDLTAGKEVYSRNADKILRPASILKIITAVTAADAIGIASNCFRTSLYVPPCSADGVVSGNIYVKGGFDPEFNDDDMGKLVYYIASLGIKRVEGMAIGDVSMTDSLYWGEGWCWDDAPSSFQPYMSPLMYEKGRVKVTVSPLSAGGKIKVFPESSFYTLVDLRRTPPYNKQSPAVNRDWIGGSNELLVVGNAAITYTRELSMYRSQDFFMQTFVDRLRQAGIEIDGYSFGTVPDGMSESFAVTHKLDDALREMLKESDNLSADATLFQLGKAAGFKGMNRKDCMKTVNRMIDRLGMESSRYKIVDGNGISLYNYVSAELIMSFLRHAYDNKSIWDGIYGNLPVSGRDGTLKRRMANLPLLGKVRAKTGTVSGVSSLAGYVTASSGHLYAFVIISNGILPVSKGAEFQNEVCRLIYDL